MTSDAFLHQMHRFEQDVQEHPEMLARVAAEEQRRDALDRFNRELVKLAFLLWGSVQR